jgi:hypothetical protein
MHVLAKIGPLLHPGEKSWPTAFPTISVQILAPSISIPRRMPTSRSGLPIRVPLGAPKSSEQSNKQSALALALLAKTPLDYPISLSAAGLCRSRLSRRQSLLNPAAAPPSFLVRVFSGTCLPLNSPFRLVAPLPRSASWRLCPVPPQSASTPFRLVVPSNRVASYKPPDFFSWVSNTSFGV